MEQVVPMVEDQRCIDGCADMARQRRVGIAFLECVELPVLEVAQSRREALADQGEHPEDVIARPASVGKMFLDIQDRILVEQPIQHIGRFAFRRADGQDAEVAVLVRQVAVELRSRFAAIVQIDVTASCRSVARTEELPVGRRGRSVAPQSGMRMTGMGVSDTGLSGAIGF